MKKGGKSRKKWGNILYVLAVYLDSILLRTGNVLLLLKIEILLYILKFVLRFLTLKIIIVY